MYKRLEQQALQFVKELVAAYSGHHGPQCPVDPCDAEISWLSSGRETPYYGLQEVRLAFKEAVGLAEIGLKLELLLEATALNENLCVVYGTIRPAASDAGTHVTFLVKGTAEGLKLVHLHNSPVGSLPGRGLQNLMQKIPGGVHQCRCDSKFTLLYMSDSFHSMFGYTREEIETRFHNSFIEMLHPSDRESALHIAAEQLRCGREIELEYRIMPKNGPPMWILDRGRLVDDGCGGECLYCLLIENTDRKCEQEALRLSVERMQVIMDQTTDIIFEWDIPNDQLIFSPNWVKKFGYMPIGTDISHRIPQSTNICPDDMPVFVDLMRETATGRPYSEAEFRIREVTGRYIWCRIRATVQFDSDRKPIKAVGVIIDIDAEKRQKQALLDQAQRDSLTGLYNKAAINALVEQQMEGGSGMLQALMIIDVDYFKAVNDTYGHLCGDNLLASVAAVLKSRTRSSDLVGRVGGDEFLVYLPQVASEIAASAKAEALLTALQLLVPDRGAAPITCSIGVAVFPRGAIDYFALFKCADQALYHRKNNGRGGVTFYNPNTCDGIVPCGLLPSAVGGEITSEETGAADEQLAQYAFRMLYAAENIELTLNRLLEIIGRSYDVNRVYIFESSDDGLTCSNTFEWCGKGAGPQRQNWQKLSYQKDLPDYQSHFSKDGVFCCRDPRSLPPRLSEALEQRGIRAILQCAILSGGVFRGFIGFDDCRGSFIWSDAHVASFRLTADVLSTFVLRLRLEEKLAKLSGKE